MAHSSLILSPTKHYLCSLIIKQNDPRVNVLILLVFFKENYTSQTFLEANVDSEEVIIGENKTDQFKTIFTINKRKSIPLNIKPGLSHLSERHCYAHRNEYGL